MAASLREGLAWIQNVGEVNGKPLSDLKTRRFREKKEKLLRHIAFVYWRRLNVSISSFIYYSGNNFTFSFEKCWENIHYSKHSLMLFSTFIYFQMTWHLFSIISLKIWHNFSNCCLRQTYFRHFYFFKFIIFTLFLTLNYFLCKQNTFLS